MWQRILALIQKEFLALLKDPKSRVVLIVPPLVQLLVFGYAASFDLKEIPYAVYDEDHGGAARTLLGHFQGAPSFHQVATLAGEAEIAPLVDTRTVLVVIHLGPRFGADLAAGRSAPVQVIVDGRNSNTAMIALNYVRSVVDRFNEDWIAGHGLTGPPARLATRAWFNPNLESRWFFIPGIVGMLTLVVTMLVTALTVAREREQGTFDQLLVTPLRMAEILIGKTVPGFVIGIAQATLILLVATLWFRVPMLGSLAAFYAGLALFLLSGVGAGLLISALSATQQQGLLGAFLFMVPAVILSGFATPIANMPPAVQFLTLFDPLRYFLVILRKVFLEGAGFAVLVDQFWPMALLGLVSLSLAAWLFRHRMY
ncbi:ABC transporter permease [Parasulfuritortus cantonensis]|uniref:ABC transporter permease n=1 Tax=Parasulfuritortus cantonensis TaxID=2528202 RepID=A0A4R1B7F8_9PROT|nr:ABC transporter permease [Parasulfuritortus cantonensis]TCJ12937.1 ABC transporter permease [Parasulfuritortus cantonensis]